MPGFLDLPLQPSSTRGVKMFGFHNPAQKKKKNRETLDISFPGPCVCLKEKNPAEIKQMPKGAKVLLLLWELHWESQRGEGK